MKIHCIKRGCNNLAVWILMSSLNIFYCDNCVPRSCSCNLKINDEPDEDGNYYSSEEYTDETERLLPCCEYWYDDFGFNDLDDWDQYMYEEADDET